MKKYPSAIFTFITGPVRIEIDNGKNVIPHLQKYSHFGFMLHWPFGFHFWLFWKLQERDEMGGWIPGTEQGIYFRLPGYRWDIDLGMIRTGGFFGGHWD